MFRIFHYPNPDTRYTVFHEIKEKSLGGVHSNHGWSRIIFVLFRLGSLVIMISRFTSTTYHFEISWVCMR